MTDKLLVKKRFLKSQKTYNDNAIIQKRMAKKLISMLPENNYNSIFEIGCATGVLTEQIVKNISFNNFTCNDLVETSKEYIDKIVKDNTFIPGDIEKIELNGKYDLIISNAALQWCEDIENTIKKLILNLNKNGTLAISTFGNNNLTEIQTILNIKNVQKVNIKGIEKTEILYFDTPLDVLKHLKYTGANAVIEFQFTKSSLKNFVDQYKKLFSCGNKVSLTYKPIYSVFTK